MKFNKLFKILLVLIVLLVCLNAVAASDEMDSFGVGAEDGNLAVENNDISNALKSSDEDVLGDGNNWYVDAGATTGGDGSQSSPYSDLQSALSNCNDGDVIHIMPGTYKGTSNTGLTIGVNNLAIVADDGTPIFDGENTRQIFKITGNNVVLKGLQLTKGKTTNGGALYLDGDNICVDKCTINSNNANAGRGGGIYIAAHDGISIINSKINGNKATYFAAGIYNAGSHTLIANCSFYDSIARNAGGIYSDKKIRIVNSTVSSARNNIVDTYGGGIYLQGAGASGSLIDNVTFSSCYSDQGGAMALKDCDNITVNNCEISTCIAKTSLNTANNGDGAGIWMNGKNNVINNTRVHDNHAPGYGVVYVHDSSENTIINNCLFYRNTADYDGSAIYSIASNVIINNSEFVKNHCSRYGGAICIKYGENDSVLNSKFDGNYAEKGGAIYLGPGAYCKDPKVDNCTFVNNGVFPKPPFDRNMTKGGAIFSLAKNPTIINSNFTHNVGLMGGAIVFENGHNTLENDTFVGNIAERYGGGAISSTRQGDTINNCTFINNQAKGYGGAIGADYPTITNSKFIGNTAFHGGAICTILANVSNSEFYDNTASDGWYIVAANELIEKNIIHPEQNSISLYHSKYMNMTYDPKNGITYVDGYTAFCVEEDADSPRYGVMFEDLRFLQNSLSEEYVGEYLKILMFKYWNESSDYADFRDLINVFTDHDFKNSNNAIVNDVVALYDSGYRITNDTLRFNDDGTVELFNFGEIIVPSSTQNVFVFNINKTNLTVKKEVLTNPVVIGKQVDFNITVKNTGECNLTSVWINETGFSKGLAYDSFRSPFNWNYDSSKKLWILNQTLGIGKIAYIILTFNVTDSGIMQNNVSVGFSNHTFANDTVDFPVYIPNMTVEKISLTPEVTVGMPAYFMIRITNTGECELSNINVTEMNSEGLAYQNFIDSTGKWIFIGSMEHPKWQYNGTLPVGRSAELMVVYNTLRGGTFTNVVAVDNNQTTGSGKNDTVIHEPMIKVEKITLTPKVPVGDLTSFRIRVTNIGDCDLEEVYVKELKFDGLIYDHFTSVSNRWTFDGKDTWTYNGILAEGERSQFIVFFKTITVGNFTNIVVAGSNSTNETTAKNVTETFENKTDDNNTNNSDKSNNTDKSNNSDKSNNINGKNNSNTTSNVPKDSNKTDVSIKRATGNPLFALLAVLLMLSVSRIRKFKK